MLCIQLPLLNQLSTGNREPGQGHTNQCYEAGLVMIICTMTLGAEFYQKLSTLASFELPSKQKYPGSILNQARFISHGGEKKRAATCARDFDAQ